MSATDSIVIAPFANERVREWPTQNLRRFIHLALRDYGSVTIVGTAAQRTRANQLVREFPATRVVNACGQMTWSALEQRVASAAFVVANNSGVAHLGASLGQLVLCIFGGAHSWIEWMPRGPRVVTVARMTPCAPCELGDQPCPNGLACLVNLEPAVAYAAIRERHLQDLRQAHNRPRVVQ